MCCQKPLQSLRRGEPLQSLRRSRDNRFDTVFRSASPNRLGQSLRSEESLWPLCGKEPVQSLWRGQSLRGEKSLQPLRREESVQSLRRGQSLRSEEPLQSLWRSQSL